MERGATMIKRFGLLLLLPAVMAFAPAAQQATPVRYRTEKGWIYVHEYDTLKSTSAGDVVITGAGRPMKIEDTGNGLTIIGTGMRIVLKAGPDGRSALDEATATGEARVIFDSELAYQTALEMATPQRAAGLPPEEITRAQIDSETIVFKREGQDGVLTFPQAVTLVRETKARPAQASLPNAWTQTLDLKGSKGRIVAGMDPKGKFTTPRTMRIDGPVTTHLVRNELPTAANPKPPISDVTSTSDLMEFDFEAAEGPTLTATGNVYVRGQARGMPGEIRGSKATIVLDRSMQPASYEFTGEPSKVRVKVGGDGR